MPSPKHKNKSKKEKNKLLKLIESDSEDEENVHELSFYINDRVKLMKEVLKIIKPKQIKRMAPDCINDLDIEEINSMLLEELLGISNKRLKYIFNGENLNEDTSSSTDPEEDKPIDVISLDDVSDDDFIIDLDADPPQKQKKIKKEKEPKNKTKIKKEKQKEPSKGPLQEENLMSVLELLELQARARAIKSQLALEASKRKDDDAEVVEKVEDDDDEDAVIIEIPKNEEIVITSDSDNEKEASSTNNKKTKIKLIRDRFTQKSKSTESETAKEQEKENNGESQGSGEGNSKESDEGNNEESGEGNNRESGEGNNKESSEGSNKGSGEESKESCEENKGSSQNKDVVEKERRPVEVPDEDEIIIDLDHEEMAGIIE